MCITHRGGADPGGGAPDARPLKKQTIKQDEL